MKITQKITQKKVAADAGIEPDMFNHILHRRCPCPPKWAPILENITKIPRTVWVWGSKPELLAAWKTFVEAK